MSAQLGGDELLRAALVAERARRAHERAQQLELVLPSRLDRTAQVHAANGGTLRRVTDFYLLDEKLTDDERGDPRPAARRSARAEVTPVINGYWERAEFPFELVPKIAALQMAGGTIEGYGCPGMSATAAGLVSMEWARADGSIGTFFGVHSNLAMQSIAMLGSEEQKQRWLPAMADLDAIGAFALTEPDHGSDAVQLETQRAPRRRRVRPRRPQALDRQRDDRRRRDRVGARRGRPRRRLPGREGHAGLRRHGDDRQDRAARRLAGRHRARRRARPGREQAARLPQLPRRRGRALAHPLHGRLARARAWRSAPTRPRSPTPSSASSSASRSRATSSCRTSSAACWPRSPRCSCSACGSPSSPQDGRLTAGMASLAKMNHAAKAREIVGMARDILGGNGILLENHVARQHADMEAIFTFEGTDSIQSLIVAREITGLNAIYVNAGRPVMAWPRISVCISCVPS